MATKKADRLCGYETTYIAKVGLSDEGLKAVFEKMKGIVESFGGEVVTTEDWGKRRLAYKIRNETRGHYTYFAYSGRPGVVAEIERNLRLNENILRFLTVKLSDEFKKEDYLKGKYEFNPALTRRGKEVSVDNWKRRTGPMNAPSFQNQERR
jgi:small subunit ribosomal protein S6